jgi:hypothetical protein
MIMHMVLHHKQPHPIIPNVNTLPSIPGIMLIQSHVSHEEEYAMGIGEDVTSSYRDDFQLPGSDDPIMYEQENALKQNRRPTVSVVEPQGKKKQS